MPTCRVIVDPPASGAWNMAVDEALLEDAAGGGAIWLRFYRWSEPTLSLGYFQRLADRQVHPASVGCEAVRRPSGGGAILHHHELTYSLAVPLGDRRAAGAEQVYQVVHDTVIEALETAFSDAVNRFALARWRESSPLAAADEPFLCFQRRSAGDVVLTRPADRAAYKVVGSAQRRRRGAILQHGSILLESSPAAPELLGVNSLTGLGVSADALARVLQQSIPAAFGWRVEPANLSQPLRAAAERLQTAKYDHAGWLTGR